MKGYQGFPDLHSRVYMKTIKKWFRKFIDWLPENPITKNLQMQYQELRRLSYLESLQRTYDYWDRGNISEEEKRKGKEADREYLKEFWKI